MRTWTRARLQRMTCGGCGPDVARGAPLLESSCQACGREGARRMLGEDRRPPTLAPLAASAPLPEPIPLVRTTPTLPLD
jgi:hypothetical protein